MVQIGIKQKIKINDKSKMTLFFDKAADFLQHMNYSSIVVFLALITGMLLSVSKFVETMFGKKYLGTWAFEAIKKRFTFQSRMEKILLDQNVKIASIANEVMYNGGTKTLTSAFKDLQSDVTTISENQKIALSNQYAIIDCSPTPIFMNDADNNLERVNPAWMKLLGVTNFNEVKNLGWIKLIPKEDREEVLKNTRVNADAEFAEKVRLVNQTDGSIKEFMCRTSFQKNKDGKILKTIGTLELVKQ